MGRQNAVAKKGIIGGRLRKLGKGYDILADRYDLLEGRYVLLEDGYRILVDRYHILVDRYEILEGRYGILVDRYAILVDRYTILVDRYEILIDRCKIWQVRSEVWDILGRFSRHFGKNRVVRLAEVWKHRSMAMERRVVNVSFGDVDDRMNRKQKVQGSDTTMLD